MLLLLSSISIMANDSEREFKEGDIIFSNI